MLFGGEAPSLIGRDAPSLIGGEAPSLIGGKTSSLAKKRRVEQEGEVMGRVQGYYRKVQGYKMAVAARNSTSAYRPQDKLIILQVWDKPASRARVGQ